MTNPLSLSFAQQASERLWEVAAKFEDPKRSPLIRELTDRIKTQKNWSFQRTEIRFTNYVEIIELEFSKEGEVVRYKRTGGNKTIDYVRPSPQQTPESPLAKYHWVTLAPSVRKSKTTGLISEEHKELAYQLAPWAATSIALDLIGKYNLMFGLGLNLAVNKWAEGKIPVTPKIFVAAAALTAMIPNVLLWPALLYGGWKASPWIIDKVAHASNEVTLEDFGEKATAIRHQLSAYAKTAIKAGQEAVSGFSIVANATFSSLKVSAKACP